MAKEVILLLQVFLLLFIGFGLIQGRKHDTRDESGVCTKTLIAAATVGQFYRIEHEINREFVEATIERVKDLTDEFSADVEKFQQDIGDELSYFEQNGRDIFKEHYYWYK